MHLVRGSYAKAWALYRVDNAALIVDERTENRGLEWDLGLPSAVGR